MGKSSTTKGAEKRPLIVEAEKGETEQQSMSRVMIEPYIRHGAVTSALSDKMIGKLPGEPSFGDFAEALKLKQKNANGAEVSRASELLLVQAQTLDAIFTEYARRATINIGEYVQTSERYMRLALKAQAGSRSTLEALLRLHQPREQTVKHVHVNEGGQALVADHFHHNGGQQENAKSDEQSHATGATGGCPALSCPNSEGNGVPIPCGTREKAMQDARGYEPGSTEGQ